MNHILYQIVDDLAIITLNRPEVAMVFILPMCEEILEAFDSSGAGSSCAVHLD